MDLKGYFHKNVAIAPAARRKICHAMMKPDRFVLCRPMGGLNDVLCQIEKVCKYAEAFNRTVVVDTNHRATIYFKDRFSKYFVSKQERLVLDLTEFEPRLGDLDIYPDFLAGRLLQYETQFDPKLGNFVDRDTRRPITFDFTKDYQEPLLVHHASGRLGGASVAALARLRLHPELIEDLAKRTHSIGPNYLAIHIRNTDDTTNYQAHLNELKSYPTVVNCKRMFVATDNIACLDYCRQFFSGIEIFSFSKLPMEPGNPIHKLSDGDDAYRRNKDAILDLLMLALSQNLYLFEINKNKWGNTYSGYSVLAHELRRYRAVLNSLISAPDLVRPAGPA